MAETLTIRTASSTEVVKIAVPGPQGIPGVGVPTGGSTGQVLRKASGADYATEWAAAGSGSGSVTSVALSSTDLTISGSPITDSGTITANIAANAVTLEKLQTISSQHLLGRHGSGNGGVQQIGLGTGLAMSGSNVGVTFGSSAGTACQGNDARLSDSRTPTTHAASHASAGSDPLAPSDIGAQSIFTSEQLTLTSTAQVTLSAARAKVLTIVQYAGGNVDVIMPQSGYIDGDVFVFKWGTGSDSVVVREVAAGSPITTISAGQQKRVQRVTPGGWIEVPVDTHTHAASAITSGTLTHERGGLEADVSAYNGLVKISGGSTSAVTVTSAGEALLDDADAAAQRTTLGLGTAAVEAASAFAAASHTHTASAISDSTTAGRALLTAADATAQRTSLALAAIAASGSASDLTSGTVATARLGTGTANNTTFLRGDGAWQTPAGGVSAVGASTADVLSVSGSDLVADDGGTIDSSDPFIKWDDAAGKLVYANPLSRPSGAFYVGLAPTTTALGSDALNIQPSRTAATQVASSNNSIAIGARSTASGTEYPVAVGFGTIASGTYSPIAIGSFAQATGWFSIAIGGSSSNTGPTASGSYSVAIGRRAQATADDTVAIAGGSATDGVRATAVGATAIGGRNTPTANLRGQFLAYPFSSVFWGGQTTNDTATVLNLDATATNRFTIAANTALAVDILLVARRSDTQDKWLVARRFLGIRRDGSNNTSLIGSVQTLGTDQSAGSPTWTFALTADDTNEALQLEVTGAASETVQWRATAFYRVV